jgi:small multidrug resistance family-3 protein
LTGGVTDDRFDISFRHLFHIGRSDGDRWRLVWLWLREKKPWWVGLLGAVALVGYGAVPTFQPEHFGGVYAAYGGVFIVMSLLWGWGLDGRRPDRWDLIGALLCLLGVTVMVYAPRHNVSP